MKLSSYHKPRPAVFEQTPQIVAPMLLGALIRSRSDDGRYTGGLIVETEAYLANNDAAAHHLTRGRTKATQAKFMKAGTIYIHRIHTHYCIDIVTQGVDEPSSILIRSLEPTHGIELMKHRRKMNDVINLASGPGKLCQAMGIDSRFNEQNILNPASELSILLPNAPVDTSAIGLSRRIGLSKAPNLQLRYFLKQNRYVSGPKYLR